MSAASPQLPRRSTFSSTRRTPSTWVFATLLCVIYLYSFPYFYGIRSANELPRIYLTLAMVDRGAVDIGPELAAYQPSPDISTKDGKSYCNKAPGMSLLAVPTYGLIKLFHGGRPDLIWLFFWFRLTTCAIPSLLFLWLLARTLTPVLRDRSQTRLMVLAYGVGTMALPYGILFIAHQPSAVCFAAAFLLIFRFGRRLSARMAAVCGFLAGFAVLIDYQVAFLGIPLFIYLLAKLREHWRRATAFGAAAAVPLGGLLYYHYLCFGSPFKTGYHYLANKTFAAWHSKGFLGLSSFEFSRFAGDMFSSDDGLIYYSPFLVFAIPGLVLMFRQRASRAEAWFCLVALLFFGYFMGALAFVSGWDVGPRYMLVALPFYLIPVAYLMRAASARPWLRIVPLGAIIASILIYAAVTATFPHYPVSYEHPLFDVTYRFARAGYHPYNLGWLFGLQGRATYVPFVLCVGIALAMATWPLGLRRLRPSWKHLASLAASLVVVVLIWTGYYQAMQLRRRNVSTQGLNWLDSIWEPKSPAMDKKRMLERVHPKDW